MKNIKETIEEELKEVQTPLIIDENNIKDLIYEIRGQKVMLDFDLARIYGYSTSAFNQQVKRNIDKFEGDDFMFQLTETEMNNSVKSIFSTSRNINFFTGQSGGTRKLPYAFTEQDNMMWPSRIRKYREFV